MLQIVVVSADVLSRGVAFAVDVKSCANAGAGMKYYRRLFSFHVVFQAYYQDVRTYE